MAILFKNARVVTATEDYTADVYAESDTISRIERNIDAASLAPDTETVDATGKILFLTSVSSD